MPEAADRAQGNGPWPAAVVFDFDGVLVDTEPLHYRALAAMFAEAGLRMTEEDYLAEYIGYDDRETLQAGLACQGVTIGDARFQALLRRKAAVFERLAREADLAALPGAAELVRALEGLGIPIALCSGALPGDINPILAGIGLADAFAIRVTAADVARSKPDPASYRLALDRLAQRFPDRPFPPARCLAIEDTPAGIASAHRAGLRVLAVQQTHAPGALDAADGVVPSLKDVAPETLARWLA
jgi:beta-phosphoglucomutase